MVGRNCGIVASCIVLVASWLCSFLPVSHDTTRLRLAQGQRPPGPGTGTAAQVGMLLDLRSARGRASRASISLALEDFYLSQPASPRISLHVVDCKDDEITAASAAIDLLKDYKVQAIIGPKTSTQARFIIGIGNQTNVPILSYTATSPYLSANPSKYFVRTALDDASQAPAITSLIKLFGWRQVGGSPRVRDPARMVDADWELRRSRSPAARKKIAKDGRVTDEEQGAGTTDLGSALLSGTLQAAGGVPPPPPHHPDPMLDFYKDSCVGDIWSVFSQPMDYDPMIGEAMAVCAEAVSRPLSFSTPRSSAATELLSPIYTPSVANGGTIAELNEEGPGVQQEVDGHNITEQVADLILEERQNKIVESFFVPCEQPVLETPVMQKQQPKATARLKTGTAAVSGLRRSTRQKAKVSSVPVSKRATHRLIKAFEVTGHNDPTTEEALEAFVKTFNKPLSKAQIDAVRRLTSLDSGAVMDAAAQLVAAEGAEAMRADAV